MIKEHKVSILMNCYNGERYLAEAIDSVIVQTYKNWELIFWDNQSTDKSPKIFKSYKDSRLKYFCADKHTTLGEARNLAYSKLSGDIIAILDSDDLWRNDKLEYQLKCFEEPSVGIVTSNIYYLYPDNKTKIRFTKQRIPEGRVARDLLKYYFVSCPTIALRKSVTDKLKIQFDKNFSLIADFDIIVRASKITDLRYIPIPLATTRIWSGNETAKNANSFCFETLRWIKKNRSTQGFSFSEKWEILKLTIVNSIKAGRIVVILTLQKVFCCKAFHKKLSIYSSSISS